MWACAESEVTGVLPRDIEGVWIRKLLGIAIRQGHFQNYPLTLGNRNVSAFDGFVRFAHEGVYRAAIAKQFLHRLRH
jgi:hypothetical protein